MASGRGSGGNLRALALDGAAAMAAPTMWSMEFGVAPAADPSAKGSAAALDTFTLSSSMQQLRVQFDPDFVLAVGRCVRQGVPLRRLPHHAHTSARAVCFLE